MLHGPCHLTAGIVRTFSKLEVVSEICEMRSDKRRYFMFPFVAVLCGTIMLMAVGGQLTTDENADMLHTVNRFATMKVELANLREELAKLKAMLSTTVAYQVVL